MTVSEKLRISPAIFYYRSRSPEILLHQAKEKAKHSEPTNKLDFYSAKKEKSISNDCYKRLDTSFAKRKNEEAEYLNLY
jgi:hypothetical protein